MQALEGLSVERTQAWGKWLDEYRCQLKAEGRSEEERQREQSSVNPCYVPRNQVMQEVIREAEAGNFDGVRQLCTKIMLYTGYTLLRNAPLWDLLAMQGPCVRSSLLHSGHK